MIAEDLQKLLALKDIDVRLDEISRAEEDERTRLREAEEAAARAKEGTTGGKKALDESLKERKLHELDLKQKEEQARKYASQQYEVKTNEQYKAILDEVEKAKKECRAVEDKILQLMLREDELKAAGARNAAEQAAAEKHLKETDADVTAKLAKYAQDRKDLLAGRADVSTGIPSLLFKRYERIRAIRGGSPLATIARGEGGQAVCMSCQMALRPQLVVEVQKQEEFVACDSCDRILYIESELPTPA